MTMETWLEPVEGREVEAHWRKAWNMSGLAKAGSVALAKWEPEKEKRVYLPRVLRREKPKSLARSEEWANSFSLLEVCILKVSTARLCMLKCPTTK